MPAVSVIMPCYNAGEFARQSVESILSQTFSDFELLVVDDGSEDNSVEILKDLARHDARIKLILHEKNLGVSRSRNDGLHAARGDYVAFCDADDLWKPEKLKCQIGLLSENPSYDVTYCDSQIIDKTGARTGELFSHQFPPPKNPSGKLFEELCLRNFVNTQTVLARRSSLGGNLLFDESIKCGEDWWLWILLSRKHRFLYEKRALAEYRVHPKNTWSTQKRRFQIDRWKVCKRNLRAHADLPMRLKATLWYYMGVQLSLLGRRRLARKFLWQAACLGWQGRNPLPRAATMTARWGLECCCGLAPHDSGAAPHTAWCFLRKMGRTFAPKKNPL